MGGVSGFLARVFAGPKAPLIQVASFLGMPEEGLAHMRSSSDEDCEQALLRYLEHGHGGVVDWRGRVQDVLEVIEPFLTEAEREALAGVVDDTDNPGFPAAVHVLDVRLRPPLRALRAIGALGDAYIVFLAPRTGLAEFDQMARHWRV